MKTKRRFKSAGNSSFESILERLDRLHPIRLFQNDGAQARVVFFEPVPWPLFMRLEIAKPFSAKTAPAMRSRLVAGFKIGAGAFKLELL